MNRIPIVPFPVDAESDPFFAALSSALLPVLGYRADTPYWCSPRHTYCTHCGGCSKTGLEKHQLMLYHTLLAISGVAFAFSYPQDDAVPYATMDAVERGWRWPDAFLCPLMDALGVRWKRLPHPDADTLCAAVRQSVGRGWPVLAREGQSWLLLAGFEPDASGRLLACTYRGGEAILPFPPAPDDLLVFEGTGTPALTYESVLRLLLKTLDHPAHVRLERDLIAALDAVTPENAQETAAFVKGVIDVPIEARWHAAEAFVSCDTPLSRLSNDDALKQTLSDLFFSRYIQNGNGETHSTCWQIWALLGVGPDSGYQLAADASERIQRPDVRAALKRLLTVVFDNDRRVSEGIHAALDQSPAR